MDHRIDIVPQDSIMDEEEEEDAETKEETLEWTGGETLTTLTSRSTCGLRNLGNSCYLNSVVQALANVPPLAAFLVSGWDSLASPGAGGPPVNEARRAFCDSLALTVHKMWSGTEKDFAPRQLTKSVIETVPEFRMHGQQDAEEALTYALNNLHDELFAPVPKELHPARETLVALEKERLEAAAKRRPEKEMEDTDRIAQTYEPYKRSIVSDIFQSLLCQKVTCSGCETTSLTVQESFNLPLELPSKAQMKVDSSITKKPSALMKTSFSSSSSLHEMSPKNSPSRRESSVTTSEANGGGIFSTMKTMLFGANHSLELDDCLKSFFSCETLRGEEQYYCEQCKTKVDATKVLEMAHLPEVLCLQLKRFNKNRGTLGLGSAKNSTTVRYPVENLDLKAFASSKSTANTTLYDLIGVVRHSGHANSGHYIATCRASISGRWFEFDDEFVTPISNLDQLQSNDAYLLFYAKKPTALTEDKRTKALQALKQQEDDNAKRVYLSRAWTIKFETMTVPGCVDNSTFACEHGAVLPQALADVRDRVSTVPSSAMTVLETLYGASSHYQRITSLEVCALCKTEQDKLQERRTQEFSTITELDRQSNPDGIFYFVSKSWVLKWLAFTKNDCGPLGRGPFHGVLPPGKVDTESLVDKDGKTVKTNLKLNVHYRCFNAQVFKKWETMYGLQGPVLARVSQDIYSAPVSHTTE